MRAAKGKAPPAIEAVATVTERLAVLLAAGVPPSSAWGYLGEAAGVGSGPVREVADAAARGDAVPAALESAASGGPPDVADAWRGLAAAWFVATESGAPLAQSLRSLAESFRALGQTQRDLAVALAGPAATARMVMALPVVGVLFGMGLGFNTLQTLFATLPGLACAGAGVLLMLAAIRWNRRMILAATPSDRTPGLAIDLMAVAMSGGGSIDRARVLLNEACGRYLGRTREETRLIDGVLELAQRAGVPAAELLRNEASARRREARSDGQRAAAALAVRLMIPLGVCVLPAFMLVGVAPLLMAIVSSTVSSF
jgi:Flp pilus assembly protein TadB